MSTQEHKWDIFEITMIKHQISTEFAFIKAQTRKIETNGPKKQNNTSNDKQTATRKRKRARKLDTEKQGDKGTENAAAPSIRVR